MQMQPNTAQNSKMARHGCRGLQEESSSSSARQAASFLTFTAPDLATAVAAACQRAEQATQDDQDERSPAGAKLEYCGDRMIPLASWTGIGQGPMPKLVAQCNL